MGRFLVARSEFIALAERVIHIDRAMGNFSGNTHESPSLSFLDSSPCRYLRPTSIV